MIKVAISVRGLNEVMAPLIPPMGTAEGEGVDEAEEMPAPTFPIKAVVGAASVVADDSMATTVVETVAVEEL